jgi:signal transduction histidine kinase
VRFTVRSEATRKNTWITELRSTRPSHLSWYVVSENRAERSLVAGSADRPRRVSRLPSLELEIAPGEERTVYLRANSDTAMLLPLGIGSAELMRQHGLREATRDAMEIGFCLAIMLLGLLLALVRHAPLYAHHALLAGGYSLYLMIFHGYLTHLWPQAPHWIERQGLGIAVGISLFAFALFNRSFLSHPAESTVAGRWLGRVSLLFPLLIVLAFPLLDYRVAVRLIDPLGVTGILAGLVLMLLRGRPRSEDLWFAAAWAVMGISIVLMTLQFNNLMPVVIPVRVLQLLIVPSILTAFFLAVLMRQRMSDSEEQQRRAEKQAYTLVENIAAGTYEVTFQLDSNGKPAPHFEFISSRFLEMFDLSREELLADPSLIGARIHPDDAAALDRANAAAYNSKQPFRWEGRVQVRGATRWFLIASRRRRDLRGRTIWTGLITDVTAEKRAVEGLQQTLENLPIAVACGTLDESPRITMMNEQFVNTFGHTMDDAPTVEQWTNLAYPDETYRREIMHWWMDALEQAGMGQGKVRSREVQVSCKDGGVRDCIVSATLLPSGPVVTFQDMTDLNRVARELEALRSSHEKSAYELTENMPAGTYAVTLTPNGGGGVDLAFRFISTRCLELFRANREDVMRDPNLLIATIHPDDLESMSEGNLRAHVTGQPFSWLGRTMRDGVVRWLDIRSNPRIAGDGVTVWEGVVNDVTDRINAEHKLAEALENEKRLRAEAEQLRRKAEAADMEKSLFLAKMSHEIRTPLSALVSLSQAMWMRGEKENLDAAFTGFLNRIRSGGQYLNLLLRNVLNVSAAQSGRVPLSFSEFYLADWMEDIRNILEPIALYHRGSIEWGMPDDDDARWVTDQMRLTQIALNLGENALKFGTADGAPVRIKLEADAVRLTLTVEDRGPGIPPEKQSGIFTEFTRVGTDISPLDEGVGLGLSVVKINTELLGGAIKVNAAQPCGMIFIVEIPLASLRPAAGES